VPIIDLLKLPVVILTDVGPCRAVFGNGSLVLLLHGEEWDAQGITVRGFAQPLALVAELICPKFPNPHVTCKPPQILFNTINYTTTLNYMYSRDSSFR